MEQAEVIEVPVKAMQRLIGIAIENTGDAIHHAGEYLAEKYDLHKDLDFAKQCQCWLPEDMREYPDD